MADRDRLEPGRSVPKAPAVRPGLDMSLMVTGGLQQMTLDVLAVVVRAFGCQGIEWERGYERE